jgi:adenylate cyclase
MFSDIKGYSKMMGADEAACLRLLEEHNAIIVPIIARHRGEVLKFIGDAILSAFESALDAVSCAVEIQSRLRKRNRTASGQHILIRIGIHVGDVVLKDGDIFGDGVNIASRIEPLAEAGGICVSEAVADMVRARKEVRLSDMGPVELKNISRPVGVYKVLVGSDEKAPFLSPWRVRRLGKWAALALAPLLLWAFWHRRQAWRPGAADEQIVIVTAPFSGTDADSIKEGGTLQTLVKRKLIEAVGRLAYVRIVAAVQAPQSVEEARALGKRFGASLVIWGEALSERGELMIQPHLTRPVNHSGFMPVRVPPLQVRLEAPDYLGVLQRKAEEIDDLAILSAGREYLRKEPQKAVTLLHSMAKQTGDSLIAEAYADFYGGEAGRAIELFLRAIALDPNSASAHDSLGSVYRRLGRISEAVVELKKAADLDPRFASPHIGLGLILVGQNHLDEAAIELRKALDLWPQSPIANIVLGNVYSRQGKYSEAAERFHVVIENAGGASQLYARIFYVLSLVRAGDRSAAAAQLRDLGTIDPAREWPGPAALFFAGRLSREQLLQKAASINVQENKERISEAYYDIGVGYLLGLPTIDDADKPGSEEKAREAFAKSAAYDFPDTLGCRAASEELSRLKENSRKN